MAITGFLKPTFAKLLLAITLAAFASFFMYGYLLDNTVVCAAIGCGTVQEAARNQLFSFYAPLFSVFSYAVSCGIVLGYHRIRMASR